MPTYNCRTFVRIPGDCVGFSWGFHYNAATHAAALVKHEVVTEAYLQSQTADVAVTAVRVSDVEIRGDALTTTYPGGRVGGLEGRTSEGSTGVLLRYHLSAGRQVSKILRCIPDIWEMLSADNASGIEPQMYAALFPFITAVKEVGAQFRYKEPPVGGAFRRFLKVNVDTKKNTWTFTTLPNTLATGDRIQIGGRGARAFPTLRGEQTVTVINDTTFQIQAGVPCAVAGDVLTLRWWVVSYNYAEVTDVQLLRLGTQKVGRPFGLLAGRSRARTPKCPAIPAVES